MQKVKFLFCAVTACLLLFSANAQKNDTTIPIHFPEEKVLWKTSFGSETENPGLEGQNVFVSVTTTSDNGIVAAGNGLLTGNGDWSGVLGKGNMEAIIVKYNNSGTVQWKKYFTSHETSYYDAVTTVSDGVVAVGFAYAAFFTNESGFTSRGYDDALIVKYSNSGTKVWSKNFGGEDSDRFTSVTKVSDGIVAVGVADEASFGTGDMAGVSKKGGGDAIIIKYNNSGTVQWKKNFGGSGDDKYTAVVATSDGGIVAVGTSQENSFGTGDLSDIGGKGGDDGIIVKYDNNGTVQWKKSFGGDANLFGDGGDDYYTSVAAAADGGIVAVKEYNGSYGQYAGYALVKYDNNGNELWEKRFDAASNASVTAVTDGVIVAGNQYEFGTGNWSGFTGNGGSDGIMIKYDNNGNIIRKTNFGGSMDDDFYSVTTTSDGIVVVGEVSYSSNTLDGDWGGISSKNGAGAVVVKFELEDPYVEVSDIKNVPDKTTATVPLALTATVIPGNATNQTIAWSVKNDAGSGANISGDTLYTATEGTVTVTATIVDGVADGNFTKDFTITIEKHIITLMEMPASTEILRVYPNPTSGVVNIDNPDKSTIEVFSANGTFVKRVEGVSVDLSTEPAGVYVLRVGNKTARVVKK